mmetsp:Transcript_8292/g.17948  ORF Transcript_8292/g.17948 Transcript_8292/m.17948 type:complete len:272 (-) Transcript_8292:277-1092(-)
MDQFHAVLAPANVHGTRPIVHDDRTGVVEHLHEGGGHDNAGQETFQLRPQSFIRDPLLFQHAILLLNPVTFVRDGFDHGGTILDPRLHLFQLLVQALQRVEQIVDAHGIHGILILSVAGRGGGIDGHVPFSHGRIVLFVLPRNQPSACLGLQISHALLQQFHQRLGRGRRVDIGGAIAGDLLLLPRRGIEHIGSIAFLLLVNEECDAIVISHHHVVRHAVHLVGVSNLSLLLIVVRPGPVHLRHLSFDRRLGRFSLQPTARATTIAALSIQ